MITDVRLGDTQAVKMYRGDDVVWERHTDDELPTGYKRCKYLESNKKQYIDTLIPASSENSLHVTAVPIEKDGNYIFGGGDSLTSASGISAWVSNVGLTFNVGGERVYSRVPVNNETEIELYYDAERNVCGFNGEERYTNGAFSNIQLVLFAGTDYKYPSSTRIKHFTYGDFRNYIPALDTSGKPCMYDTVSAQPFYNIGKGEFGYELEDGTYVAPI